MKAGVDKFGKWFRKRGWLGEESVGADGISGRGVREKWWGRGEGGVRVVVEFATAYAITKALLPFRLLFSVWATPWFARVVVVPTMGVFKRVVGMGQKAKPAAIGSAAAGAGVAGVGVVPKEPSRK